MFQAEGAYPAGRPGWGGEMCAALRDGLRLDSAHERHIKESGRIPGRIRKPMKGYQQGSDTISRY